MGPVLISLVCLIGAALVQVGWIPNLVFLGTYRFDLAALLFFSGLLLSLGLAVIILARQGLKSRIIRALDTEHAAQGLERQHFLRRLDHELKNPLTTIRLGIANLEQEHTPDEKSSRTLERIAHQAQRLQTLVEDLRRLAEMKASSLDSTEVSLQEILDEAVDLARSSPEWRERVVQIDTQQVPWPISPICGDHDLLVVAFRNLIDNALKFTDPNGRVEVHAFEDGHSALVEINDDGRGIFIEDQPHIFEELYRGENSRDLPGSGLGLALVRRIIELHGGSVDIYSKPEQGTMVRVHLPLINQ